MEFGVQFFPNVTPAEKPAAQYYDECLKLCELLDTYGYTHVRTVEHYFHHYGGYSPNPVVFLTAASQRTQKARLITGAVLPVFNHPLKVAGEIGMLDGISNGRLEVGLGRAFLPQEFRAFGVSLDESVARFDEGLDQIRRLLEEENVTCEGRFHSFKDVTSMPRPTQTPRPQFWTAAVSTPDSFEKAGRRGDWIMAIPIAGGKLEEFVGVYREAWKSAGHPGEGRVMLAFFMLCHEDREEAKRIARQPVDRYFSSLCEAAGDWGSGTASDDYKGYDKLIEVLRQENLDTQIEKLSAWVGTPDDVEEMIREYAKQIGGFDDASLQTNFTTVSYADAEQSMRLFGEKVLPRFAKT
ncbi:MAG: LLM class flavin-dependent oxidoreductase [Rhodospirillaceae bacterium]|jgi:alkanesulfonate monooxygenase SsuD/methylene tetrahydromethanopterin reductase-like flavin-dependent oxidoreductase (luciferase family)|nr:LLM class flavin-dependent oxidoreductase [Rhodospirillaceae bacterium]MBT5458943.1 LLM class flavin-dependent oxidoreductase [Rhodospirillaceae bacterium]